MVEYKKERDIKIIIETKKEKKKEGMKDEKCE